MKTTTFTCALLALFWISLRVHTQLQPAPQEDYEYLRRLRVPDTVVNCVAALDRWAHQTSRQDSLLVPDRRGLNARIERNDDKTDSTPAPFDLRIHMRGFARVRGKYRWVPISATCSVWHQQVVDVAPRPRVVR